MAANDFKDHFSAHAASYARYRPRYPEALFAYLAAQAPAHGLAWDCATGNGQAAHGLAPHFEHVVATDASARQIAHARPHPRIRYHVAPASSSPLPAQTADLVTVAQALHWLDLDGFYAEVRRVTRPGAILAVWTYNKINVDEAIEAVIARFNATFVGPCWPPERALVEDGYRSLPFPFEEIVPPAFTLEQSWRLADLLGYLRTWSATRRYLQAHGTDPVAQIEADLAAAWGDDAAPRTVRWRLHLRVGRVYP